MIAQPNKTEAPFWNALRDQLAFAEADPRAAVLDSLVAQGLPHRRLEGWRWSDVSRALAQVTPAPSSELTPAQPKFGDDVFEITRTGAQDDAAQALSNIDGVQVEWVTPQVSEELAPADQSLRVLAQIAAPACLNIRVDAGAVVSQPILLSYRAPDGTMAFFDTRIEIGAGAKVTLIDAITAAPKLVLGTTQIELGDGAVFKRYSVCDVRALSVVHSATTINAGADAEILSTSISTGAKLCRHEFDVETNGENVRAHINSASLVGAGRHADFTSNIAFDAANCTTEQRHKTAARGDGKAVFQGKFYVARGAQKTNAQMSTDALLLSDRAEANHMPALEIYADDVECAHGSTCGAVDDDALFYMQQRGLPEDEARALIIRAFIGEVLDSVEREDVTEYFAQIADAWLGEAV